MRIDAHMLAGYTLTSRILLLDVLRVIKSHGFSTTKEPLILSFENHCGVVAQDRIADMIETVLGDLVLREAAHMKVLPSPKEVSRVDALSCRRPISTGSAAARARVDQGHGAGVVAAGKRD